MGEIVKAMILEVEASTHTTDCSIHTDHPGEVDCDCGVADRRTVGSLSLDYLTTNIKSLDLGCIAGFIVEDWGNKVNYAARPYLAVMRELSTVDDSFGYDSGRSVVLYFLANAGSWRGPVAKLVKKELNRRCK